MSPSISTSTRFVLALVLVALAAACSKPAPPNVVVIVLDTARPDYLSVYGHPRPTSPFLEAFAKDGVRYDRAYSTSSWTLPAHASMFSGLLPAVHHATQQHPQIEDSAPLIAERLANAGYETAGFSNNPWVSQATGLARGFQHFQDKWKKVDRAEATAATHPTVVGVKEWLDARAKDKPFFVFVNLIEPHMPYLPNWEAAQPFFPDQQSWFNAVSKFFQKGKPHAVKDRHYGRKDPLSPEEWKELTSLYEGELRLTDAITQAIVEVVDAHSDPANTLVLLVSDHGENLGDHGHLSHMFNLYDSNIRIALLARGPGFARGTDEKKLVQITDIYPTLLRAADLEVDKGCVGIDLRRPLPQTRLLSVSLDLPTQSLDTFPEEMRASGVLDPYKRSLEAAVSTRFKMIRGSDKTEELYDIVADPNELHPLKIEDVGAPLVKGMSAFIDVASTQGTGSAASPAALSRDPEVIEALRSLGYVQ